MNGRDNHPAAVLLTGLFALAGSTLALAADEAPGTPDTSRWRCRYCTIESGRSGYFELGAGNVDGASDKFGEYNDLNDKTGHVVANGALRYRNEDGRWYDLALRNLGTGLRSLSAAGGRQGKYKLSLDYRELPHHFGNGALTPFSGAGSSSLALPAGWVRAGSTASMSALLASLQPLDLSTTRRRLDLAAQFTPVQHWGFAVDARREARSGSTLSAGAFLFNSVQLPMPVDSTTWQFDAAANYNSERLQARIGYYASVYDSGSAALTWSNAYLPLVPGADTGQLARPPSNDFHQLRATASLRIAERTSLTADLALGRMLQDETFLPYTSNGQLVTAPLPRRSLDGRVDTTTASLRLNISPNELASFDVSARYEGRDNRTPQALYSWVTGDAALALPRMNQPYGSSRTIVEATTRLRPMKELRIAGGMSTETRHRDLQEVRASSETRLFGRLEAPLSSGIHLLVEGSTARRTTSGYEPLAYVYPAENPLLRKFNLTDRDRDMLRGRLDAPLGARTTVGLTLDYAWDNYPSTVIGLLDDRDRINTVDVGYRLTDKSSLTAFWSRENIDSHQDNAALLNSAPTWFAGNRNQVDTASLAFHRHANDRLDLDATYSYARTVAATDVENAVQPFPDITSRRNTLALQARYRLRAATFLQLGYRHEEFRSHNWALDGVSATTIGNVVSFMRLSPEYDLNLLQLSAQREF